MNTFVIAPIIDALPTTADDQQFIKRHAALLGRLARELNVSLDSFFGGLPDADASELLALVRHWSAIKTSQGRRRVLGLARQEAGRAGYKDWA